MTRRIPLVTLALIALNVLVYLFVPSASAQTLPAGAPAECAQAVFAQRYGAVPVELTRNQPAHIAAAAVIDGRVVSCPTPSFHKRPFVSALTSTFAVPFLVPLPLPAWLIGSPSANVAYVAHVVGFVAGLMLAMAWPGRRPTPWCSPSRST